MMKIQKIKPEYVEFIPEQIKDGVLYVSERYRTAVHKCCCGCGREIVTPLSSAEWVVRRNGNQVSLWPSIGNWSLPCRSHYIIRGNRVLQAGDMTGQQIRKVKARDKADKEALIASINREKAKPIKLTERLQSTRRSKGLLQRILQWWQMR